MAVVDREEKKIVIKEGVCCCCSCFCWTSNGQVVIIVNLLGKEGRAKRKTLKFGPN